MATKSSISGIDDQTEKLRKRKRFLTVKSAERFAKAAIKSGLAEQDISDEELDAIFEEIFERFQLGSKNPDQPISQMP